MKFLAGHDAFSADDIQSVLQSFLAQHTPSEPGPRPWRTPGEPARDDPPFRSTYQAIEFAWTCMLDGYASKSPGDPNRIARLAAYGGATGAGSVDIGQRHVEAAHAPLRALRRAYTEPVPINLEESLWLTPEMQLVILLARVLGADGGKMPLKRIVAELEDRWGLSLPPKRTGQIARAGLVRVYADLRARNLVPVDPKLEEEAPDMKHDLTGWSQIAAYLGVAESSARRYADKHAMPVSKFIGQVVAQRARLDRWRADMTAERRK